MELNERMFIETCREMEEQSKKFYKRPTTLILHPRQYAEMKKRGWIVDGMVDWVKVAEDTSPNGS
jgi:hypothetical protein